MKTEIFIWMGGGGGGGKEEERAVNEGCNSQ